VTFGLPYVLLALLLVPVAIAGYALIDRRRARTAPRWGNPALLPYSVASSPGLRRHVPIALLLLALTALLVGAARPRMNLSVKRQDATVMLALDVSYSMTARDVRPTRLGAARTTALAFLQDAPSDLNVGIVSFESGAHLLVPPTTDRRLARRALASLHAGEGTALADAVRVSLDAAGARQAGARHRPIAILVVSDGAQTQGRLTPAAVGQRARARSVPIYAVALGTREGIVERPLVGGFHERIAVPADPTALQRLAQASGGQFFATPDVKGLRTVYERLASKLESRRVRREVSAAFAGAGGLLLLAGGALSAIWFRRLP
jgi:Ca-activated chloride channel family protein